MANFVRNKEFVVMYRFHRRVGSVVNRNNHSSPFLCIQGGAIIFVPA